MKRVAFPITALAHLLGMPFAAGADWPHFMGPGHDRKSPGDATWTGSAPRKLREIPVGGGFSSFVTGGGRAYTVVPVDGRETVIAVDRTTGKTLWQAALGPAKYRNGGDQGTRTNSGGDGPRTTPVFAGNRLFVFGGGFDLHAFDAATGKMLWSHDLIRDFGGTEIVWSNAASPLVIGDLSQVILVGNRLVATIDAGRLVVIDPTPAAYRELAGANVIEGKVWSTAAYSDGQLLLRSTKKGVCLKL